MKGMCSTSSSLSKFQSNRQNHELSSVVKSSKWLPYELVSKRARPFDIVLISTMSTSSHFTVSSLNASRQVSRQCYSNDDRSCYLMQITLYPVYTGNPSDPLPHACYKRLLRLVNGIPLGAGVMKSDQTEKIKWRYVESLSGSGRGTQTFISEPMYRDEAEDAKRGFKDRLIKQSRSVFGDITVKVSVILSQCIHYDEEFYINDVADIVNDGLHFRD